MSIAGLDKFLVIRSALLKEALEDPETRLKMNCAISWTEIQGILAEFTKKKGFSVGYIEEPSKKRD